MPGKEMEHYEHLLPKQLDLINQCDNCPNCLPTNAHQENDYLSRSSTISHNSLFSTNITPYPSSALTPTIRHHGPFQVNLSALLAKSNSKEIYQYKFEIHVNHVRLYEREDISPLLWRFVEQCRSMFPYLDTFEHDDVGVIWSCRPLKLDQQWQQIDLLDQDECCEAIFTIRFDQKLEVSENDDLVPMDYTFVTASTPLPCLSNSRATNESGEFSKIVKVDEFYQKQTFAQKPENQASNTKQQFRVATNLLALKRNDQPIILYQYSIGIIDHGNKKRVGNKLFWKFVEEYLGFVFPPIDQITFDGKEFVYSKSPLIIEDGKRIFIDICRTELSIELEYKSLIEIGTHDTKDATEYLGKMLNSIISRNIRKPRSVVKPHKSIHQTCSAENVSRPHHHQLNAQKCDSKIALGSGLEALPRLSYSIKKNLEMGYAVNVHLQPELFYEPNYPLCQILADIILDRPSSQEDMKQLAMSPCAPNIVKFAQKRATRILRGAMLSLTFGGKSFPFQFSGFTDESANTAKCVNEQGDELTIAKFFADQGISLVYQDFPCVKTRFYGEETDQLIPAELVSISEEPQKFKGRCSGEQLAQLNTVTALTPPNLFDSLKTLIMNPELDRVKKDKLEKFGFAIDEDFVSVEATVLKPPCIVYGNDVFRDTQNFGCWKTSGHNSTRTVLSSYCEKTNLNKIIVPSIITIQNPHQPAQRHCSPELTQFYCLMETVERFGQPIWRQVVKGVSVPGIYHIFTHHQSFGAATLREKIFELKSQIMNDESFKTLNTKVVPLIIVVFSQRSTANIKRKKNNFSDYAIINQICDVEIGIACQGILIDTYTSMGKNPTKCAIAQSVASKILSKIGTIFHRVEMHEEQHLPVSSHILFVGVSLENTVNAEFAEGGFGKYSIAGVVGNIDLEATKFGESVVFQLCKEGTPIVSLTNAFTTRISEYCSNTGSLPDHVVIFRDSLMEKDFQKCLYEEKNDLIAAFEHIEVGYRPTISYIVCNRNHRIRFKGLTEDGAEGLSRNVKPGTLIESEICSKKYFDFYLVSHQASFGTARPSHYYVLHDDWNQSCDMLKKITFALCHNFPIAPKSIRVPCVIRYSKRCAKRAIDRLRGYVEMTRDIQWISNRRQQIFDYTNSDDFAAVEQILKPHHDLDGILYG